MVCQKCNESGVYNVVLGKGYFYCKKCKAEIDLELKVKKEDVAVYSEPVFYRAHLGDDKVVKELEEAFEKLTKGIP